MKKSSPEPEPKVLTLVCPKSRFPSSFAVGSLTIAEVSCNKSASEGEAAKSNADPETPETIFKIRVVISVSCSSSQSFGKLPQEQRKGGIVSNLLTSKFKYPTTLSLNQSVKSSPNSVLPTNPYSSASQLHNKMVLKGFQPFFDDEEDKR